ncbi:MAG: hypothetical protein U0R80_13885 [Nocardioidaceae bacterium]
MKKLLLLGAVAVGYVLGARAGRQRYEQIKSAARTVKNDPRVRETTHQAADLAATAASQAAAAAKEQAPVVKERLVDAAHKVTPGH